MTTRTLIHVTEIIKRAGVSRHTVNLYARAGLIEPVIKKGGRPLYEEEVVERIERITRIRRDLGVNLAGVQVILDMRRKIETLQENLLEVVEFVHEHFEDEIRSFNENKAKPPMPKPLFRPPAKKQMK